MGMPTYAQVLEKGLHLLPPRARRVREAVATYFSQVSACTRRVLAARFRQLARFMRLRTERWHHAADRLFALSYPQAEDTVKRYRTWIIGRDLTKRMRAEYLCHGFRRMSEVMKNRGVLKWAFRHRRTLQCENNWAGCPPEFRRQVEEWLRFQRVRSLARETLRTHRNELRHLGFYLQKEGISFRNVAYADALAWLEKQRDSGLVPTGFNRRLHLVQRFYAWLRSRKIVEGSPFETFLSARYSRKLPKVLGEQEMARLIRGAEPGRNRAVLEILYASGCRIGDLCKIDLDKLSLKERTAQTRGKGGHEMKIYLNDAALRAIRAYLPERARELRKWQLLEDPALLLGRGGVRLTPAAARGAVDSAAKRSGLDKHVHPHMIRHSFATHLLNRGADIYSIMQFLGHTNIQSTVRYLQVATAKLSEVHRKFHPRR